MRLATVCWLLLAIPGASAQERGCSDTSRSLFLLFEPGPDRAWVDIGEHQDRVHLAVGYSHDEVDAEKNSFAWSDGQFSIISLALGTLTEGPYELGFRVKGFAPLGPLSVRVLVNSVEVGDFPVAGDWSLAKLKLPAGSVKAGENFVELQYSRVGKPVEFDRGADFRPLAVAYDLAWLRPAGGNEL